MALFVWQTTAWLSQTHRPFKKGYLPGWTEGVCIVQRVVPGPVTTYLLTEWDGTTLEGQFYEDVQPVTLSTGALFRIENNMQRHGTQVKVGWMG